MNRHQCPGREHRPLHAFLTIVSDEAPEIGEVAELRLIDSRFSADGQRLAYLRYDHAYFAGRHLYPGEFFHFVQRPHFPPQTGHQQFCLISRLAIERDRIVTGELLAGKTFRYQPDFRRTNPANRKQNDRHCNKKRQAFERYRLEC